MWTEDSGSGEKAKTTVYEQDEKARQKKKGASIAVEATAVEKLGCGEDGGCCYRNTVDEDAIQEAEVFCCCPPAKRESEGDSTSSPSFRSTSSSSPTPSLHGMLGLPGCVNLLSGRPVVKNIIQRELERALGESAVVVCGRHGLLQAMRTAVVELSDERAVHKGTGTQGVNFLP